MRKARKRKVMPPEDFDFIALSLRRYPLFDRRYKAWWLICEFEDREEPHFNRFRFLRLCRIPK